MAGGQGWSLAFCPIFLYKVTVGKGGQGVKDTRKGPRGRRGAGGSASAEPTLSAGRFADLTGVSRERLRTWERRHGFPRPVRTAGGPRRYRASDAARVVAVREAAETGVPVARAITMARRSAPQGPAGIDAGLARSLVADLPLPVLILSGPEPLVVEYTNEMGSSHSHLEPGTSLLEAAPQVVDGPLHKSLLQAFAGRREPVEIEHAPWSGPPEGLQRSLVFRLPPGPGTKPACAVVSIDAERERRDREQLSVLVREHERETAAAMLRGELMRAAAQVTERLKSDDGPAVLRAATAAVREHLGALDAGLALYMTGELVLGTSTAGMMGPSMVLVAAHEQLGRVVRDSRPAWLEGEAVRAFGAPPDMHCLAVPVLVAGETVGMVMILFGNRVDVSGDARRFLDIVLGPIGFALIRDRFLEATRSAS
jgi:DNA-binding transcriptional MerR regulator